MRGGLRDAQRIYKEPGEKVKSAFLTDLVVKCLDDKTWEIKSSLEYRSKILNYVIHVPIGFVTDFASVPRLPLIYLVAGGVADCPATIHDFLYQKHECSKSKADRVFLEAMKVIKIHFLKRQIMYWAVVLFGWTAYASGPDRYKILND